MTLRKSRKYHEKFILSGGPFNEHIVTLSRNAFNTTLFSCGKMIGRYVAGSEEREIWIDGGKMITHLREHHPNKISSLPCLFWKNHG